MSNQTSMLIFKLADAIESKARETFAPDNLRRCVDFALRDCPDTPLFLLDNPASCDEAEKWANPLDARLKAHGREDAAKMIAHRCAAIYVFVQDFLGSLVRSDPTIMQNDEMLTKVCDALVGECASTCNWLRVFGESYVEPSPDALLMSQKELAEALDMTPKTIQRWAGKGMPVAVPGDHPRYRLEDVQRWNEARKRGDKSKA